jgi:hypothetical protein
MKINSSWNYQSIFDAKEIKIPNFHQLEIDKNMQKREWDNSIIRKGGALS